ncbi:MAG: hypothetical protein M3362_15005, partial [Acidobacteriota bacterium]|nr:hypothetical protein [Acidobacteriota bacterium]
MEAKTASELYLEMGDSLAAWSALQPLSNNDIGVRALLRFGRRLKQDGHVKAACEVFERALVLDPEDKTAAELYDLARGELCVLNGTWTVPNLKVERYEARMGRVLHVVGKSLPHAQSGYTVRTQQIARAQLSAGLDPQVVTELGFGSSQAGGQEAAFEKVGSIFYHR